MYIFVLNGNPISYDRSSLSGIKNVMPERKATLSRFKFALPKMIRILLTSLRVLGSCDEYCHFLSWLLHNTVAKLIHFNLKLYALDSILNIRIQFQASTSNFNFKVQIQTSTSNLNFKLQPQTSKFNFKLQLQTSTSTFNFNLKL